MMLLLSRRVLACVIASSILQLLVVIVACRAQSRLEDLTDAKKTISSYIADIRPKLFSNLPLEEQTIYQKIGFEVLMDDHTLNAWASPDYRVTVTVAMGRAIEMNTDA